MRRKKRRALKKLCPVKPNGMLQWIFKISGISMIFKVQFQHEMIPALWRQAHLIPKHGQPRSRGCHPAGLFLNLQLERGEYGADPQGTWTREASLSVYGSE